MMKGIMKMKRQTILPSSRVTDVPFGNKSRMRAAALAALSVTAIILGVIVLSPKEQENIDVELQSVATLADINAGGLRKLCTIGNALTEKGG